MRIGQLHLTEPRAVDTWDAVVPGQAFVDERVVGAQQLHRAAVLSQDVAEEQLRLAAERLADVVVEVGEHQQVGRDLRLEIAQLQPLPDEVTHQRIGTFVGDHAPYLRSQHARLTELPGDREIHQRLIGNAAPQEERQPRCQLDVVDRMRSARLYACGILFDAIEERRAGENSRQPGANAGVEVALGVARLRVELHRRRDVFGVYRPAIRAARQVGEDPLRTGRFIRGRSRPADEYLV